MHFKLCYDCGDKMPLDKKGLYCDKCRRNIRININKRTNNNETQKVYNKSIWRKVKAEALKRSNHMCEVCRVKGKVTPADHVHHIIKVSDGNSSTHYNLDNLIAVCAKCHNKVEGMNMKSLVEYLRELSDMKDVNARLKIIYGPPCSGKTTYVKEHMKPGDIVIDMDYIKHALTYSDIHSEVDKDTLQYMFRLRKLMLNNPKPNSTTWLITTSKEYKDKYPFIDEEEIVIFKSKDDLYRLIDNDDTRKNKLIWKDIVDRWFDNNPDFI